MEFLSLENLEKRYSAKGPMIVKKVNLSIDKGEFVVFLGPSGCGKTTIIRMIAGLEDVTGGDIKLEGRSIVGESPKNRGVSMIFQSYAVWPHMTVHDNIAYPLKLKKLPKAEIERIVAEVGATCELTDYMKRYPSQLSGGQRQRIAVARAIAVKPKLFLMDEPLSNLDAKLRVSMRTELKRIHEQIGATSIFVTHDQSEAMSLADKIVVLNNGKIEQVGTPYEVYHKSETMFVASFIGAPPTNFFDAEIVVEKGKTIAKTEHFSLPLGTENANIVKRYVGKSVKMGVRPEKFVVHTEKTAESLTSVNVEFAEPQGSYVILIARMGDNEVKISTSDFTELKPGTEIFLEVNDADVGFFDPDTGKRIKTDPVYEYLEELYPDNARSVYDRIQALIAKYTTDDAKPMRRFSEKDAFLITYGDTLSAPDEKPLATLNRFAGKYLKNTVNTVHLLPIYPYTSDDGFSVLDYRKVDERLGDWPDVAKLSERFNVMTDAVLNHVSADSAYVRGYLAGETQYADFFIDADPKADYSLVTRPRTSPLLTDFTAADGSVKHLWTTFSADQVDFNVKNPEVVLEMLDILLFYASQGVSYIRLDAIGLLWKKLGTACMHLPETHKLIKIMRSVLTACFDVKIITETNVPHEANVSYFGDGDEASMVYQFPLPPLTMYSFLSGDASYLTDWAKKLETAMPGRAYFNFLSSHDGIGVRPVESVLDDKQLQTMIDHTVKTGGRVGYRNMPDGSQKPYELNVNYLSAVTDPEDSDDVKAQKFMAAESIPLSLLGIPGIYIHSLLGSENDVAGMEQSGINRRINREKLSYETVVRELGDPTTLRNKVFTRFSALLRLRAANQAFSPMGEQHVLELDKRVFALERAYGGDHIVYAVNVSNEPVAVTLPAAGTDLVSGAAIQENVTLQPYQFVWLKL